jgi:hypothetical protein
LLVLPRCLIARIAGWDFQAFRAPFSSEHLPGWNVIDRCRSRATAAIAAPLVLIKERLFATLISICFTHVFY